MNTPRTSWLFYAWPDMFSEQPGLGHMKEIVRLLLIDASLTGRVAILPPLISNPEHFPGPRRPLVWRDYYDWSHFPHETPPMGNRAQLARVLCRFKSFEVVPASVKSPAGSSSRGNPELLVRHFDHSCVFADAHPFVAANTCPDFDEPRFSNNFPSLVQRAADVIASRLSPLAGVLHIRRGDLSGPNTSIEAVVAHLLNRGVSREDRVFVMTNERDHAYLHALRERFTGLVYEHECESMLRELGAPADDNYFHFRVGKCLQARHDRLALGTLRFMEDRRSPASSSTKTTGLLPRLRRRLGHSRFVTMRWLRSQSSLA